MRLRREDLPLRTLSPDARIRLALLALLRLVRTRLALLALLLLAHAQLALLRPQLALGSGDGRGLLLLGGLVGRGTRPLLAAAAQRRHERGDRHDQQDDKQDKDHGLQTSWVQRMPQTIGPGARRTPAPSALGYSWM